MIMFVLLNYQNNCREWQAPLEQTAIAITRSIVLGQIREVVAASFSILYLAGLLKRKEKEEPVYSYSSQSHVI